MMPAPRSAADVAHQDAIAAYLREHPGHLTAVELAGKLDHVLCWAGHTYGVRRLEPGEVLHHCQQLWRAGYLHKIGLADSLQTRWAFIRPEDASTHRRNVELWERDQFTALAALAGDKGPTR